MFLMKKEPSQEQNHEGKCRKDVTIFYQNLLAPEITQTCVLKIMTKKKMNPHIFTTNILSQIKNIKNKFIEWDLNFNKQSSESAMTLILF